LATTRFNDHAAFSRRPGWIQHFLVKGIAMAWRVDSELLLVGSLPADSAESALRSAAGFTGADGTETMRDHAEVVRTLRG
jgi:hypothetical protein